MQPVGKDISERSAYSGRDGVIMSPNVAGYGQSRLAARCLRRIGRWVRPSVIFHGAMTKSGATTIAAIALIGGSIFAYFGSEDKQFHTASISQIAGFEPGSLVLNGNVTVTPEAVENALVSQMGSSIFSFDTGKARETLLENPWLKNASVKKVYPQTIRVDVTERQPFAFWKSAESVNVIARDGVVLGKAAPEHMRLPQVVGQGANLAAPEFIATLTKFPALAEQARAFVRVAGRRWNLALRNDVTVLLPEKNWREALVELDRLQTQQNIFERSLVQIDMRLPDRLVLRLDEDVAKERRERLEDLLKRKWHKT